MTNKKYGRLKMLSRSKTAKNGHIIWLCLCDCGRRVEVNGYHLRSGKTKSCGCLKREIASLTCRKYKFKHGHCKRGETSHIYRVWTNMLNRCNNPKSQDYKNYGGRGITVCKSWHKFEHFLTDIEEPPTNKHQLDRINNDGNYNPNNCRWATKQQQMRNTSRNRWINFNDKILCSAEWETQTGIPSSAIRKRLKRGWSIEETLTIPIRAKVAKWKKKPKKENESTRS